MSRSQVSHLSPSSLHRNESTPVGGLISTVRHRTSTAITFAPPSFSFFTSDSLHHRSRPIIIQSRATQPPMEAVTTIMRTLLMLPFDEDKVVACCLKDVCLRDMVADDVTES
ncbi:unnamed protein product [Lactuca saligna]|uniref:Uncharacterized protein n=1 Tax=Lactuca saligna TaxID=75948 RepID=A0AA35Z369_LACSI|nr:unnamed protein product [Lactuca saligna]